MDEALGPSDLAATPGGLAARMREAEDLYRLGAGAAAAAICARLLAVDPAYFQAVYLAAVIAARADDVGRAAALFERAIDLDPRHPEAHFNLGLVRRRREDRIGALASYERAIALQPEFAAAHFNRANLLQELGKHDAALAAYERAIECAPRLATAHANRGALLARMLRLDAALASLDRALELREDYAEAHCNRALVLREAGRWDDALRSCERALELEPGNVAAHVNKALVLLVRGALREAWPEYEWRLATDSVSRFGMAPWRGAEPLAGKTMLLHAEQGLGDTLQFCRYAQAVAQRGARVILEVQGSLLGTLAGVAGVSQLVAAGDPLPHFDAHCPLLSLPLAFGTTLETIPRPVQYLRAAPERTAMWRDRIEARSRAASGSSPTRNPVRVGLNWSGNPAHRRDSVRSIALAALLRHLPAGLEYVSLQREVRAADAAALAGSRVMDFSTEQTDYADAAALCECVDLVVSVDTSIAHLAGALGRPTWLLLPFSPDWRWLLERSDSPWYPTLSLYRQEQRGDWSSVLARLGEDLARRFVARAAGPGEAGQGDAGPAAALHAAEGSFEEVFQCGLNAARGRQPHRAAESFAAAAALRPAHAPAHANRGLALAELGRWPEALASYDRALALDPDYAVAWSNRGNAQQRLGEGLAALASFDRALALRPDLAETHLNRGALLQSLQRWDDALASYERALELKPGLAEAWSGCGVVQTERRQFDAAQMSFERALALAPASAEARVNLGVLCVERRRIDAAIAAFEGAIGVDPGFAPAHFNLGMALLSCGRFAAGWPEYEWRPGVRPAACHAAPPWRGGGSLEGRTILLQAEQGLGDTLQFCRYVEPVAALGARVLLAVQRPLVPLLRGLAGAAQVIVQGAMDAPPFDLHCPLLSLPLAFGTSLATIPRRVPYLRTDPARVAAWRARIEARSAARHAVKPAARRLRVGLMWSGSAQNRRDASRSLALPELLPHLPVEAEYVSLQREVRARDAAALAASRIMDFSDEQTDFAEAAALCACVDLVISVDTSIAHLAGALGVPTWLLLSFSPDWRWLHERSDTPWYPSLTLYRQTRCDDWSDVLGRVAADLARRTALTPLDPGQAGARQIVG